MAVAWRRTPLFRMLWPPVRTGRRLVPTRNPELLPAPVAWRAVYLKVKLATMFTSRSSLLIITLIMAGTVLVLYYRAGERPGASDVGGGQGRATGWQDAALLAVDNPSAPFPVVTVDMRSGQLFEGQVVVRGQGGEVELAIVNAEGQRLQTGKAAPRWTFNVTAPADSRYQIQVLSGDAPQGAVIRYRVRSRNPRGQ